MHKTETTNMPRADAATTTGTARAKSVNNYARARTIRHDAS